MTFCVRAETETEALGRVARPPADRSPIRGRRRDLRVPSCEWQARRDDCDRGGQLDADEAAGVRALAMLTAYGVLALTFMMLMYALERRGRGFILAFAGGCALSSAYGFLAGTWP